MATPQDTAKAALASLSQAENAAAAAAAAKGADTTQLARQADAVEAIVEELAAIDSALITTHTTIAAPQSKTEAAITKLEQQETRDIAAAEAKGTDAGTLGTQSKAVRSLVRQLANIADAIVLGRPSSSTDNAVARFDGTDGKVLQNSGVIVDDSDNMAVPGTVTANDDVTVATGKQINVGEIVDPAGSLTVDVKRAGSDSTLAIGNSEPGQECNVTIGGDLTVDDALAVGGSLTVDGANAVVVNLWDANSIVYATSDNTPVALTVNTNTLVGRQAGAIDDIAVSASRIVGRTAAGNVDDLTAAQVLDIMKGTLTVPFISNQWYNQSPRREPDVVATALVLATNTIWYYLMQIDQTVSLDALGTHVATAEAAKNARVAIYNSDGTPQPTTLVIESDPLSLAAAAAVTDAVTETELAPGLYWWAINADSTTAATRRFSATANNFNVLGSTAAGGEAQAVYTEAHALGAFPATATPAGPTTVANVPLIKFQVV